MIQRFFQGSVFLRIIVPLIGMMVPLYILSFVLYSISAAALRQEIMENMSIQLDFHVNDFENEIQRIRSMQYELMNDEDINYLANAHPILWNYEEVMMERRIERRLVLYKYSSKYIQSSLVHIPGMGKTLSSERGLQDLSASYNELLQQIQQNQIQEISMRDDGWYLHSIFPQRISYERPPIYVVETILSRETIDETFSKSASVFGGSFAYNPENGLQYGVRNEPLNNSIIDAFAEGSKGPKSLNIPGLGRYLLYHKHSQILGIDFFAYTSENVAYAPARKLTAIFVLFSMMTVFAVVIFTLYSRKIVHKPVARLVNVFERLEGGDLEVYIKPETEDEFKYLYTAFNRMVQSLKSLFTKVATYEVLTREAQLKQLQAQINPHFLYNCLYIIYRMAQIGDIENVVVFTNHLTNYYRYITRDAHEEVPLIKEIEHAKDYTAVQKTRFSNRVDVYWGELPEEYCSWIVPRLILQPLIENAFQHGLKDVDSGGRLSIIFDTEPDCLRITVENNGKCPSNDELQVLKRVIAGDPIPGETTALRNIQRRVTMLYGEESGLYPNLGDDETFRITLVLKRRKNAENSDC